MLYSGATGCTGSGPSGLCDAPNSTQVLLAGLVLETGLINVCATELSHTNLSSRPLLECPESSCFQMLWGEGQRGEALPCVSRILSDQGSISKSVI